MHRTWKATTLAIQAPNTTQRAFRRNRKRTLMTIDTLRFIALVACLTRRLSSHDAKRFLLKRREVMCMAMWTLVALSGVEVTAACTDVVLIASFEFLETLDFVTFILEWWINTL